MIVVRDDRVGCSARINKKTCTNRRTIQLAEIERRILKVLQEHPLSTEVVASAVEAYRIERERLVQSQAKSIRTAERDLAAVTRKISGVITAIEAGGDPRSLAMRINELEAERRAIETRLPSADPQQVLAIHPKAAQCYEQRVAEIHTALSKGDEAAREAVELVRELIDRIVVTPTDDGEPMKLELVGNVAALLEERPANTGAIVDVAGPRNHLYRTLQRSWNLSTGQAQHFHYVSCQNDNVAPISGVAHRDACDKGAKNPSRFRARLRNLGGATELEIAAQLGHSNAQTTRRYVHIAQDHLQQKADIMTDVIVKALQDHFPG